MTQPAPTKKLQGFATMTAEKRRAIASIGGKTAHALGKAHKFTSDEARLAGSIGGKATQQRAQLAK